MILDEHEKVNIIKEEVLKAKPTQETVALVTNGRDKIAIPFFPKAFSQIISLKVRDLSLSEVLRPIMDILQYNLILGPGVNEAKLSLDLQQVTIEHALDVICYKLGISYKLNKQELILLTQETKVYSILLPPIQGQFHDITSNESFIQPSDKSSATSSGSSQQIKLGTKILVESHAANIGFWEDIEQNLKMLVSAAGQFSINKPAGTVIVTDVPSAQERISKYFEDLNQRIAQQIEVDVKVVEVVLNDENRFGVDWNALANDLKGLNSIGMATNFASGNFTGGQFFTFNADGSKPGSGLSHSGIRVAIDALKKQGRIEIVSQPRITMLNNQVAVIQVGSTQSYIDHTNVESTQTGTITSASTSQVQEGVTMRLLGNMVGDQIYLSVTPVVTTIDGIRSITVGNATIEAPQTTTKSINTLVKLTQGQTVAIGGLMTLTKQKNKESVPILSKVPVLGKLFEYSSNKRSKTELVIFITPRKV